MPDIDFLDIDGAFGGSQYWFKKPAMYYGGCSTVCACHVAALAAAKKDGREALCPFDGLAVTKKQFRPFFRDMFKYVYPGPRGMPKISLFEAGLAKYADSKGCAFDFEGVEGNESYLSAESLITRSIDGGFSPQFLLLNHTDAQIDDIEWHWFSITGYERREGDIEVAFSTWGERRTISLRRLWETGCREKGGVIVAR